MLPLVAPRQPQVTRERILQSAFQAVYEHGLSATALDAVLASTGVTKGALYHHFESKQALGCAVVDEVVAARVRAAWIAPLAGAADPVAALQRLLRRSADAPAREVLRYGCPLNNLVQEVAALDDELRERVEAILREWVEAVRRALVRGQEAGTVRQGLDAGAVAVFVVGAIEGALGLGKATRDRRVLGSALRELAAYLDRLRPGREAAARRRPAR